MVPSRLTLRGKVMVVGKGSLKEGRGEVLNS
jgi:hypothetical protein